MEGEKIKIFGKTTNEKIAFVCPANVYISDPVLGFQIFTVLSLDPDAKLPFGKFANTYTTFVCPVNVYNTDPVKGEFDFVIVVVFIVVWVLVGVRVGIVVGLTGDTKNIHFPGMFTFDWDETLIILFVDICVAVIYLSFLI